ncbi:MAG: 30S ribosomal protein S4 [Candidatus Heimdallarchaeota archaeon LC_2]|nr:MAG: 30S ribosomal protein S4 [Candidatus Heimdallarchaeota archaeon LC_2]
MGDPRKGRKKYTSPGHPYQKARLENELIIIGKYGLRNKKELWRARTKLANYRSQARSLLGLESDTRIEREKLLIDKLNRLGIISVETEIDDVLSLEVETILKRRLQTQVLEKGLAGTIYQARQLITHRHIMVQGRIMTSPSYIVPVASENDIAYASTSPFGDEAHTMNASLSRESTILEIPEKKIMRRR